MEKFSKTLHGYNPKEVNAFLDDVIAQVDRIVAQLKNKDVAIAKLQSDNNNLIDTINRYKTMEGTMNKTIVAAQDSGEQIRRIAKQESDIILSEARANANRIVSDALIRAEKTEMEANQLRKNINVFKHKMRNMLEAQIELVDDIEVLDI